MDTSNSPTHQAYGNMSVAPFNLCVDDFGIKYIGREHFQHLYDALRKETYEIVEDLEGDLNCGIALKWNYAKHHVDLSMVKYVMKQLTKYGHVAPLKPQHCPYLPHPIKYGKDNQAPSPLGRKELSNKLSVASSIMHGQWTQLYLSLIHI